MLYVWGEEPYLAVSQHGTFYKTHACSDGLGCLHSTLQKSLTRKIQDNECRDKHKRQVQIIGIISDCNNGGLCAPAILATACTLPGLQCVKELHTPCRAMIHTIFIDLPHITVIYIHSTRLGRQYRALEQEKRRIGRFNCFNPIRILTWKNFSNNSGLYNMLCNTNSTRHKNIRCIFRTKRPRPP
ncbi:hypothetical protein VTN02DRAFT_5350 [Thermoascus thermophilus]